ncbi:hypothetical protein SAMN06296036_12640 [Pseudobacteriovorax antillogorgiicola]|uniref:Uncharacterized protein n=1 Tax=Pseudobacteriovorax antillogorgiicola TaxID=1513793 RepID=A0A1Y6CKI2_9BACT|nr:hypothetical protein EDD56_12658 [Pseudobacteriovorax antillogorgiicola]SMF71157.1 hypothetical protein SAMN06296036_12640 [Pseudobacteriovorax antillogorgiicola]
MNVIQQLINTQVILPRLIGEHNAPSLTISSDPSGACLSLSSERIGRRESSVFVSKPKARRAAT